MDVALGLRVRTLRKDIGISQADLANATGVTFQQIQKYEHGGNRISFSRMVEIAAALNMSPLDLISPLVDKQMSSAKVIDHLAMLRTPHAADMLNEFCKIEDRKARVSVLQMVRAMAQKGR